MSKYSSTQRTVVLLVAIISSVALVVPDFFALTPFNQNANSSTTTEQNENTSMGGSMHSMGRRRRNRRRGMRRRGMRRTRGMAANTSDANMSTTAADADNTSGAMATTNTSGGMTDDLSGTYTGTLNMPEHNMSGPATLTVTGSSYTLDAGSMQHSGRFVANTTRGYTAVTAELGPTDAGQTPTFVSLRARRLGNGGLSLMSVPGETHKFSFTTAGGGRRRGGRRGMRGMPADTGTGANANTSDTGTTSDTTMTTGDNSNTGDMSGNMNMGRRGRRRGRRGTRSMSDNTGDANTSSNMTMTGDNANGDMSMNGNMNMGGRRGRRRGRRPATNMNDNMNSNTNNNMTP